MGGRRRATQALMPGLAEPPAHTSPTQSHPDTHRAADQLCAPSRGGVAARNNGNVTNIHGGSYYQAQTVTVNQQNNYTANTTNQQVNNYYTSPPTQELQGPTAKLKKMTNMSVRIAPGDISSKRTPETGKIFQGKDEFKDWLVVVNSILWASGHPGAGKTYLASALFDAVYETVKADPRDACTIIYLKQNDQWTTWDIVSLIIIDLVESNPLPAAIDAIHETLQKQRTKDEKPSLADLVTLLQKIVKVYRRCYILIDGPDEMDTKIQVALVDMIAGLEANVLLTSRPLTLVQEMLAKVALAKPVFTTVAAEAKDLELFIKETVHQTPMFASLLGEWYPLERFIRKIQDNAAGIFLHAALQMEALRHCIDIVELVEMLDQFPPGLEAMYEDTMKRLERQPSSHVLRAKTALVWLVHASGTMSIDDLRCATATFAPDYCVEPKRQLTKDILLTICCGLVTLDPITGQVRLIHATARDALRQLLLGHCSKPQSMITTACISRLVESGFHNSSARQLSDVDELYRTVPLLRYAHGAVQHHVQEGLEEDPGLLPRVEEFVRQCRSFPYEDPLDTTIHGLAAVHVATLFNQPSIIAELLESGAGDVNLKTSHERGGISPLAIASLEGLVDLTRYLLTIPDVHPNDGDLTPLMCAAINGREAVTKQLLLRLEAKTEGQRSEPRNQVKAGVNRGSGRDGDGALGLAAWKGHVGVVELLLRVKGVDVNQANDNGWTPLLNASLEGHVEVVKLLFNAPGIDVNQANNEGVSPLFMVSHNGQVEVMKLLLNTPGIDVNQANNNGASPLLMASQQGHVGVVRLLLNAPGIDVNQANNEGVSPLLMASHSGQVEVMKLLLNTPGIDVNQANNEGVSPLFMASHNGHVDVVQLLLNAPGINVNQANNEGVSPLFIASENGHVDVVQLLLNAPGIDINQANNEGTSPLFMASQNGHVDVVKLLLNAPGIHIKQATNTGTSPLLIASEKGHVNIVKLLLNAPGISVNQANNNGVSPLFMASQNGHVDVVKLLLNAPGIDVNQASSNGSSPLFMASQNGHVDVVKLLLNAPGIDANQSTKRQISPLIVASYAGCTDVVKALLEVPGIDITHKDMDDETALTAASSQGYHEIVQILSAALESKTASLAVSTSDVQPSGPDNPKQSEIDPQVQVGLRSPTNDSKQADTSPPPSIVPVDPPIQPVSSESYSASTSGIPFSPFPLVDVTTSVPNIGRSSPQATGSYVPSPAPPLLDAPEPKTKKKRRWRWWKPSDSSND